MCSLHPVSFCVTGDMDRLTKRWERRRRFARLYSEHGDDAIDEVFDRVFYYVRHYKECVKEDRTLMSKLRHYTHLYEDLLLCGVYNKDERHERFLARLKRMTHSSGFEQKMHRRIVKRLSS